MTYLPTYSTCITSVYTHQPRGGETFKLGFFGFGKIIVWRVSKLSLGVLLCCMLHAWRCGMGDVSFLLLFFPCSLSTFLPLSAVWLAYWRLSCLQCTPSPPAVIRGAVMGLVRGE
jgi:hypothetical protein